MKKLMIGLFIVAGTSVFSGTMAHADNGIGDGSGTTTVNTHCVTDGVTSTCGTVPDDDGVVCIQEVGITCGAPTSVPTITAITGPADPIPPVANSTSAVHDCIGTDENGHGTWSDTILPCDVTVAETTTTSTTIKTADVVTSSPSKTEIKKTVKTVIETHRYEIILDPFAITAGWTNT